MTACDGPPVLLSVLGVALAAVVAGACGAAASAPARSGGPGGGPATDAAQPEVVDLADVVAAWPSSYTVRGSKSEPLYTEHVTSTRQGDVFAVVVEVVSQGDAALGTQRTAVRVGPDGRVQWLQGCTKNAAACADDPALRGFASAAALLSAQRRGHPPATGTVRAIDGEPVVCLDDDALHPAAPGLTDLQPCFSRSTGALLGHWSDASGAFVGPSLFEITSETAVPDTDLLSSS